MLYAGIDAGSRTIKVVLLDGSTLAVVGSGVADQGVGQDARARRLLDRVLRKAGFGGRRPAGVVATGYGRAAVSAADTTVTEITCHAAGVHHELPEALTVIDIGGQDSKLMRLNRDGTVRDFAMNDRCAAGTGCFLEVVAGRLKVPLEELGQLAARSASPAPISSTCVVFAETEIIGLLAAGRTPEDIAAGIQQAVATRVAAMAGRNPADPVVFAGGVALLPGMNGVLASALGHAVSVAPNPQMTGALGAAILAARMAGEQA